MANCLEARLLKLILTQIHPTLKVAFAGQNVSLFFWQADKGDESNLTALLPDFV